MCVCLYVPGGHLLGKGWPLVSRLWCATVSLSLSNWYPGSGVVFDCIDSWSLHPYLLYRLLLIHMYQWQTQHALPLVPSDPWRWRWQKKLLCSVVWHYHQSYVQHYMANLMLVKYVIASHAEVWTRQFWWKFYQELTVTMVHAPKGMAVSTQGQHYVQ